MVLKSQSRVLILSPHTDDAEIAMGATISRLVRSGCVVRHEVFSLCEENIPGGFGEEATYNEFLKASEILGVAQCQASGFKVRRFGDDRQAILDLMILLRDEFKPDVVFIPSHNDIHQDHTVVHQEALRAFKHCTIYGYEMPWNNYRDAPDMWVPVTNKDMNNKIVAVGAYLSQAHRAYTDWKPVFATARMRGNQINAEFAEAFYQYRTIWRED